MNTSTLWALIAIAAAGVACGGSSAALTATTAPDAGTVVPPDTTNGAGTGSGAVAGDGGTAVTDAGLPAAADGGTGAAGNGLTATPDAGTTAAATPDAGVTVNGLAALAPPCGAPAGNALPAAPVSGDVYLRADICSIPANTFNNPAPILMWGFVLTDATDLPLPGAVVQVPGPTLETAEGATLTIHLKNNLSGPYTEPVSLVIPGQTAAMTPVFIDPSTGLVSATGARPANDTTSRVRSFNAEAAPGASVTYTFSKLQPGTYLYESGTHPQVQMQMGLYGALIVDAATAGQAYDDVSSAYASQAVLLFSEIDSAFHDVIAAGHYGTPPAPPAVTPPDFRTSTIHYRPDYFLINGRGSVASRAPLTGGHANAPMLLRFLNAGLASKTPEVSGPVLTSGASSTIAGTYLSLIAQDGNFIQVTTADGRAVAAPRRQTDALLPAGATLDALVTPATAGTMTVLDRRLNLSNAGIGPGGQSVQIVFTP